MSQRFTEIPVAPCKLCGNVPSVRTTEEWGYDFDPHCGIMCYHHLDADCVIELSCSEGEDGVDCERKAIELWNKLNSCCETCTHFEFGTCFREYPFPDVMPNWVCEHYGVRQ